MKKTIYSMLVTLCGVLLLCVSICATITANIGMSSFDALTVTTSRLAGLSLGDAAILTNLFFIAGQSVLTRFKMPLRQYFQVVSALSSGFILDGLMAHVFRHIVLTDYWQRVLLFMIGTLTLMIAISLVLTVNFMKLPFEGFCIELANTFNKDMFGPVRQTLEIGIILFTIYMTVFHGYEAVIREGTIIGMLIGTYLIVIFRQHMQKNTFLRSIRWD